MAADAEVVDEHLEALLGHLRVSRGFDFTGYKRASLARRITKRMQDVGVQSYGEYTDFLEFHPEEFSALFNTVLINVTRFFRDDGAWKYLAEEVLPRLVERQPAAGAIRVWSAGCASGEETYTIAMVFAELLGTDGFRERVKIYGTDLDEEALAKARQATYTATEVEGVPPALLEKYFDQSAGAHVFKKDLRRQVIFGRHDLIQDAPISRVDLIVCRNTLMYFNAETQSRVLSRFHFALNDRGLLFLGKAETMLARAATFTPIDLARRISTKIPPGVLDSRDHLPPTTADDGDGDGAAHADSRRRLREIAADLSAAAEIVVDLKGVLVAANEQARSLFFIERDDIGRPLRDLKISYRPTDLRSLIDRAYADRRSFLARDVEWPRVAGESRWLELHVVPIIDPPAGIIGVSIAFNDVSGARRLQGALEQTNVELEGAYAELQSTNEELETTNEELQSTIEELQTTNEELQSTNEELETMNEQLQARARES